jgi:murein DD-endopeptidase MepM/ murein hydrolase activator NlpD
MLRKALLAGTILLLALAFLAFWPHRHRELEPVPAPVGSEPAGLKPKQIQALRDEDVGDGRQYWIRNLVAGPIEVDCVLDTTDNVAATPALPRRFVLAADAEQSLTILRALAPDVRSAASITCTAVIGDPRAVPDSDVRYGQPFYPGTEFVVTQGYNGRFSHNDLQSQYAVDFGVPEGTPVVAARAGVVMEVENEFRGHGVDIEKFGDRANYVRILHADGSMAVYAHLSPESSIVRPGDKVRAGEFLAKSGSTGFATGPHLHFVVQRNAGMALTSLPFTMSDVNPN